MNLDLYMYFLSYSILKKMKCYLAAVQLAMVLTGILSMIVQKGIGVESDL